MKILIPYLLLPLILLTGCANPGVVQISPDTYQLSRSSAAGAFANTSALKARVINDANVFAQKQGKIAVPLNISESRPNVGFPSCDITFTTMTAAEYARQREMGRRDWSSLTPAQRTQYYLTTQEIQQRDRAASSAERQASAANWQNSMDRMSYNQRTQALSQPVNVNVNGTLDIYGH